MSPKEGEAISWQMFCRAVFTGKPEVSAKGTEHAMSLVLGQGSSKEPLSLSPPSRRHDSCKHHSSRMSQGQRGRLCEETWSEDGAWKVRGCAIVNEWILAWQRRRRGAAGARLRAPSRPSPCHVFLPHGRTLGVFLNSKILRSFSKSLNAFQVSLLINDDWIGDSSKQSQMKHLDRCKAFFFLIVKIHFPLQKEKKNKMFIKNKN